ncbi:hypothetical protein LMG7141_02960 [Ralstonia condita]|jgi:type II secretory pathway component PulJ|uniref:Uncharacterized protein n=1 Tax=Ralstonia condita TaxID=3058600 RepID=A0ABM9JIE3_9RALS|nr:type II secretion system protein [Ralstonia sp. LMG 7141]CAJ0794548.1 hypothetical protein LMG7141_02960 [Ralstonia sp. LMG 7141]
MSAHHHLLRQHGAILIESLVALALLSLGAVTIFEAFDYLEATSRAASQFNAASPVSPKQPAVR